MIKRNVIDDYQSVQQQLILIRGEMHYTDLTMATIA